MRLEKERIACQNQKTCTVRLLSFDLEDCTVRLWYYRPRLARFVFGLDFGGLGFGTLLWLGFGGWGFETLDIGALVLFGILGLW